MSGGLDVARRVPEVRIVARPGADEISNDHHFAGNGLLGVEKLLNPRIVTGAVRDHNLGARHRSRGIGARFEEMRVLIGIGENARHLHVRAADLFGDVAVKVLRGDDADGIGDRGAKQECGGDPEPKQQRFHVRLPPLR